MVTIKSADWKSSSISVNFVKPYAQLDEPKFNISMANHPDEGTQAKVEINLTALDAMVLIHYLTVALASVGR